MESNMWLPKPWSTGASTAAMIADAGGATVELLAYHIPPKGIGPKLGGFKITGRRPGAGHDAKQRACSSNDSREEAQTAALTTGKQPRETWTILPAGDPL
jgi:hypothetical protein